MTLTVGATGEITATVEPSNASNKKVNWTTSDANVASVDQNGLVTAVAEGTATITATSAADSSKKASCVVTVAVPGTWKATGRTGFNTVEGTAYVFQEFELIANDERLSLHKDKVKSITVDGKALTPNTDETLWFNVLKATGDYKFVVVDSDGVTYIATLSWIASEEVTATKVEGSEGDHDGNYYQLYTVEVDVTPEDSKVYQIKPDGTISELTVLTDNDSHLNIWFRLYGTDGAQQAGNHIFLIKKGEIWSKAVISHGHAQATWKATGGVGTHTIDGTAYVFQGYELLDETNNRIDLVADNIAKMTVLDPDATEVKELTVGDDTDPLMWFNVRKASGAYKYTVTDKDGKVYKATLDWTAPAEVNATKSGEPAYNAERGETYQLYTVEVDVTPADSKVYQIKPDGTIGELTVLADADDQLNIWFRLSGGVGLQQEGDHVFLIKKGETWSKAVINYKATEDPMVTEALDAVNNASSADNYAAVKSALETNAAKLGLDLTEYEKLTPVGRQNAVANDIYNNKPNEGYTIETLKPMFDEIVATRMVFQNSVAKFAAASADNPLTDLSYITILIENLEAVKLQEKHSGRSITEDILPELNKLVEDFETLTEEQQKTVLKDMNYSATTSSTATRNALRAAINKVKVEALSAINDYLTSEKYVYADAPGALEEHLVILGLGVGAESDYAALDKTGTSGKNRKTAVFYDLNNNKPPEGYDLANLTTYFNDMVATRLVTEESMDLVNNAKSIEALNGMSFVTMLLERFQTVSYGTHSDIPVETKISTLQGLVDRYNALGETGKTAVLTKIIETRDSKTDKQFARSQHTTDALADALTAVESEINSRLEITGVSVVDNKAYASTAAGEGNTVRVLGYSVGIRLNADESEKKKVSDTTSIVIELYKGETLLGQQTFSETGYTKHADKSATSGTIDAGGQYVATSWDNSWSAGIAEIPDKAVATVQYTDGTATAEMTLSFTEEQTKIFYAAEAVHALFEDVFAETLVLAEGVTQDAINAAQTKVNEVSVKTDENKAALQDLITKAQALLGGDEETGTNIQMLQAPIMNPEDPVAEEPLAAGDETEVTVEETIESDEVTTNEAVAEEVNEEEVVAETAGAEEIIEEIQYTEEE